MTWISCSLSLTGSRCWSTAPCSLTARPKRSPAIRESKRFILARKPMPELLSIENLSAGYGEAIVLSGVSLTIAEGHALALLGRNGMGKTTLVNTIVGVTRYFGGKKGPAARRTLIIFSPPPPPPPGPGGGG